MKSWKRMAAAALILWFLTGMAPVRASPEQAAVPVWVSVTGPACTAVLYEESGAEADRIILPENGTGSFSIHCDGLGEHRYTVGLAEAAEKYTALSGGSIAGNDENDSVNPDEWKETRYDPTVYQVKISIFLKEDQTAGYAVMVTKAGALVEKGKMDGIRFVNRKISTDTPPDPQTADPGDTPGIDNSGDPGKTPGNPSSAKPGKNGTPVKNTGNPAKGSGDVKSPIGKLPQTGTLLWLVPLLAGGGWISVLTGIAMRKKKGGKGETKRGL